MNFWLDTMGFDYFDLNAFDAVAVSQRLGPLGHRAARARLATGSGYRPDGARHSHSRSLADVSHPADRLARSPEAA